MIGGRISVFHFQEFKYSCCQKALAFATKKHALLANLLQIAKEFSCPLSFWVCEMLLDRDWERQVQQVWYLSSMAYSWKLQVKMVNFPFGFVKLSFLCHCMQMQKLQNDVLSSSMWLWWEREQFYHVFSLSGTELVGLLGNMLCETDAKHNRKLQGKRAFF